MAKRYHDKLSRPLTLLLVVIAAGLIYLIDIAVTANARAEQSSRAATQPSSEELLKVKGGNGIDIDYETFKVNFNPVFHIPNYVAWELTVNETKGHIERGKFRSDNKVEGCAASRDYTGSGYDRGHMAPAGDMKFDQAAMDRCFLMTNIVPQSHALNGGTWNKLEEKCRNWARVDSAIIIICGPILNPEPDEFIGKTKVAVPRAFFKVVLSPFANPPRAIGFIMPNSRVAGGLQATAVSVDSVESVTGLDFFSALPDSIENMVESKCNFHYWSTLK